MYLKVAVCFLLLCVFTTHGENSQDDQEAAKYLTQYGYLSLTRSGNHDAKAAIKRFQKFFHLEQTGELDEATLTEMHKPRCGMADVGESGDRVRRYKTGPKWRKTSLTYKFEERTQDINHGDVQRTIVKAFNMWSAVTPLRFREVSGGRTDFTIRFVKRSHGDGSPFDGRGRVLAHAYFPQNGRIHFDEDESWGIGGRGTDLLWVAVHEIGHAIGLHHSDVRGTIMWPSYGGYKPNIRLHNDDIRGIQSLYGNGEGGGGGGGGGSCSDKSQSCSKYKSRGYCSQSHKYYDWMKRNCAKTCGMCEGGGGGGGGGGSCTDKDNRCRRWSSYCQNNDYVKKNCKKTCSLC